VTYSNAFLGVMRFVLRWEGGYVSDPRDLGGETYRGVARNRHPDWPGWITIDAAKVGGTPGNLGTWLDSDTVLQDLVTEFYHENFWRPIHGDDLPPKVAMAVMDTAVNMGPAAAASILQRAVGATVDGVIGPRTLHAAQERGEAGLRDFLAERMLRYVSISDKKPQMKAFLRGWTRRVMALALEL